jgi:antitoxin ParD1/3/4
MNVSLTNELEQYVTRKVRSGLYHSASEVIRDGIRLLKDRDALHQARLAAVRKEIDIGLKQLRRGEFTEYDENSLSDLLTKTKRTGREKLAGRKKKTKS